MYLYWIISLNMVVLEDRLPANLPGGKILKKRPSQLTKAGKAWNSMSKEIRRFTDSPPFPQLHIGTALGFPGPTLPFPIWFGWISTPLCSPLFAKCSKFCSCLSFLIFLCFGLAILLATFFRDSYDCKWSCMVVGDLQIGDQKVTAWITWGRSFHLWLVGNISPVQLIWVFFVETPQKKHGHFFRDPLQIHPVRLIL